MTDRPIIFSAPMVRAILEGRKTMTRRVLKTQPSQPFSGIFQKIAKWWTGDDTGAVIEILRVPYAVGDSLWVRESFRFFSTGHDCQVQYSDGALHDTGPNTGEIPDDALPSYFRMVDRAKVAKGHTIGVPSIHMPRWASRITLEVTALRVERLQDISEADAKAEGVERRAWEAMPLANLPDGYRCGFAEIWTSLHGPGAWEANPWVAVIEFKRIDEARAEGR